MEELLKLAEQLKEPYMAIAESTLKRWENMRRQYLAQKANQYSQVL